MSSKKTFNPKRIYTAQYVKEFFIEESKNQSYINFHKIRYSYLLNLIEALINTMESNELKFLDVGPMHQTKLIRGVFANCTIDTMGTNFPINNLRKFEKHINIDLNSTDSYTGEIYPQYDIIVFSEVIEHLYTKPEIVIKFLKQFLKKGGYIIIQTPNGLAIHHRLKLLFGIHPYQLIKESRRGHYREYAPYEMKNILENCKLEIYHFSVKNYFNNSSTLLHKLFVKLEILFPKNWRDGMTFIGYKPKL